MEYWAAGRGGWDPVEFPSTGRLSGGGAGGARRLGELADSRRNRIEGGHGKRRRRSRRIPPRSQRFEDHARVVEAVPELVDPVKVGSEMSLAIGVKTDKPCAARRRVVETLMVPHDPLPIRAEKDTQQGFRQIRSRLQLDAPHSRRSARSVRTLVEEESQPATFFLHREQLNIDQFVEGEIDPCGWA